MWKIIYGLATPKQGEEDPFKGTDKEDEKTKNQEEEKKDEKKEERKKRRKRRKVWRR